jgi:hypothetical protein
VTLKNKDILEDNAFYSFIQDFYKRLIALGGIGCKLTYFARNILKFDYFFGHQAYNIVSFDAISVWPCKIRLF